MQISVWHKDGVTGITFCGEETVTEVYLDEEEIEELRRLIEPPRVGMLRLATKKGRADVSVEG